MESMSSSKSRLFLLELILSILIFSVASAVCVRLFAKARSLSDTASELKMAVLQADSAAQSIRASGGDIDSLLSFFPEAEPDGSRLLVGYDKEWSLCPPDGAPYRMTLTISRQGRLISGAIQVESDRRHEPLYSLSVRYFLSPRVQGGDSQ